MKQTTEAFNEWMSDNDYSMHELMGKLGKEVEVISPPGLVVSRQEIKTDNFSLILHEEWVDNGTGGHNGECDEYWYYTGKIKDIKKFIIEQESN